MSSDFNYDTVVKSHSTAIDDGFEPGTIYLGYDQMHSLYADANFISANDMQQPNNNAIGRVAGIDVEQVPLEHFKALTAEDGDHHAYYIL